MPERFWRSSGSPDSADLAFSAMRISAIADETNRGKLLDVAVFTVNVALMGQLTKYAADLLRRAGEGDIFAKIALGLSCLAMLVLPAAGAVLKRWHFHERMRALRHPALFNPLGLKQSGAGNMALGCLCNPIFYFVLSIVIAAGMMSLLQELFFGKKLPATLATTLPFLLLSACVAQTVFVYRYFVAPRKPPESGFLRNRKSELLGDVCIFVNMMLFQVVWNIVVSEFPFMTVESAGHFAGNLFFLTFFALLIYFPPRIFYLAEDINRPATWLTMLLANLPAILRTLFPDGREWRGA